MDRRRSLLKIAALRSERERQAGVKMGYDQSITSAAVTALIGSPVSIGTGDFTLEYFGNSDGSKTVYSSFMFNAAHRDVYSTGSLFVYSVSGKGVGWIVFEKPSSGDPLLDSIDLITGETGTPFHFVLTRNGTTVKAYFNGELKATKEQSAVKDLGDFRLGMSNGSNMIMSRIYNYALSAEEVAAHYNDGDPSGYVLPAEKKYVVPFSISGQNSYTWTGDADSIYSRSVLLERMCKPGTTIFVKGTVSDYQSGVPFIYAGRGRVDIPAKDGDFTVMVTGLDAFDRVSYYGGLNGTDRRLTITINSVEPVGCVAEYLPQNLVRSPHDDPVEIVGKNSHTWTGVDAPVSFDIKINRVLSVGGAFRITGSVSNYKSGTPYLNLGHNSIAYLPKDNSPFTLVVTLKEGSTTLFPYIYIYGGSSSEDKQLTITVDSVELIPDVALSWLDSAKQHPLNDEYLPPLFESIVIGDATPIHITGDNSYTWTGADDRTYGKLIPISRTLNVGSRYRISVTVSDYEAGSPFINISGTDSASIPSANGTYELELAYTTDYPNRIILYGGQSGTERRVTLTVNSIEPIVEHSYDLTANGMPQIIIK